MSSPVQFQNLKQCAIRGCSRNFASRDSHRECYHHRKCELTKSSPILGGRPCEVCSHWSEDDFKDFRVRLARRHRQSRSPTPASPRVSFSLKKPSKKDRKPKSSSLLQEPVKSLPLPFGPQPKPIPAPTHPLLVDEVAAGRRPSYSMVVSPGKVRIAAPKTQAVTGAALGAPSTLSSSSSPAGKTPHSPASSSPLGKMRRLGRSPLSPKPSHPASDPLRSPAESTPVDPSTRRSVDASTARPPSECISLESSLAPQPKPPPPSSTDTKLDAIMEAFLAFRQSSSDRFAKLEERIDTQAHTLVSGRSTQDDTYLSATQPQVPTDGSIPPSGVRTSKRRRVDAAAGTDIQQSDASVQTESESEEGPLFEDSDDSIVVQSVYIPPLQTPSDSRPGSSAPQSSSAVPPPPSPGLAALLADGMRAHQEQLPPGVDQDALLRAVSQTVSDFCKQPSDAAPSHSTGQKKHSELSLGLPPGVQRTSFAPSTGPSHPPGQLDPSYKIPRLSDIQVERPKHLPEIRPRPSCPQPPTLSSSLSKEQPGPIVAPDSDLGGRRSRSPRRKSPAPKPVSVDPPPPPKESVPSRRSSSATSPRSKRSHESVHRSTRSVSPVSHSPVDEAEPLDEASQSVDGGSEAESESPSVDDSDARPFRNSIKQLIAAVDGLKQASDPGPIRYPEDMESMQTGRAREKPLFLPPHPFLKRWYDFAVAAMSDSTSAKRGAAFNSPALRRSSKLYGSGKEGDFLLAPRAAPDNFALLSNFQQQDHVKRALTNPVPLSSAIFKAVDQNVRVGLGASSYASHFLDGAQVTLSSLQTKVDGLAAPAESSAASRKAVDDQRKAMLPILHQLSVFVERAKYASFDALGSLAVVDVNLTLAQRDKFVPRLRPYLVHHAPALRHATCMSKDLLPNVPEISALARDDAAQESTRQLATHLSQVSKSQKPQQPPKGKAKDGRGKGGTDFRQQPFQARPQQTAKGSDGKQYGASGNTGNPGRQRKRKRSQQGKSK